MKISIIVLAHNEEKNLEVLISKLVPILEEHEETWNYELVVINDNSIDRTPKIIEQFANRNPRVKPIHRYSNPGLSNAVWDGYRNSTGDIIIPMMCDLSHNPQDILQLVREIEEGYDIVYGSRFMDGSGTEGYPIIGRIANYAFNSCVRLLFGIKHKDITSTFKAYRKEVLESMETGIEANGFDIIVDVPLRAHIMGFTSIEVPVTWRSMGIRERELKLSTNASKYGKCLLNLFFIGNMVSLRDLFSSAVSGSRLKLLGALIFGILILIGIFSYSGYTQIYETIKKASLYYVFLGFITVIIAFILRTWRWSVLLQSSGYFAPKDILFKNLMFGFLLNYILPARAGDIARGAALKATRKIPMGISLSTIVIERAVDMLTLTLVLGAGAMFVSGSSTMLTVLIATLTIAFLLIFLLFFAYRYDSFISRRLGKRIPNISGFMNSMKEGLYKIYSNPGALVLTIAISIPIWIFEVSGIYLAAMAIGYKIPFSLAAVAGIISFISQTIPITPAGLGVYEGTMAGILVIFGIPLPTGISIALVDHFVRASVTFILGIISTIHLGFASRAYFAEARKKSHIVNETVNL